MWHINREEAVGGAMPGVLTGGTVGMCSSGSGKGIAGAGYKREVRSDFARSGTCLRKSRAEEAGWAGGKGEQGGQGGQGRRRGDDIILLVSANPMVYICCT